MNTIIQVPVKKQLRNLATVEASRQGFSSLQEAIRIFLHQLSSQNITISFTPPPIPLSAKAIKKYDKISKDIETGKTNLFEAKNINQLMSHLRATK